MKRKLPAILLIGAMLLTLISGCGKNTKEKNDDNTQNHFSENSGETDQNGSETSGGVAMGRYMEDITDLSDRLCGYRNYLYKLEDGSLIITDREKDFLISKDNGITWNEDPRSWYQEMLDNETYIMSIAIGKDNTVGVIYDAGNEDEDIQNSLVIIRPDGTQIPADISITEDDVWIDNVWIADNGRIFASTLGPNIYEVMEDGSSKKFLTITKAPELIKFQGNLMIMDGYDYDSLLIYDMEKEEYVEDEVLNDFIKENYGDRGFNGSSWYDMYFFSGEEKVLYLAGKKGLHRHVIGGSAMEQVIDGRLCIFNDPGYGLLGMAAIDNNEFLAVFQGGVLDRFTFDPDIPTIPGERLKVYSLKENNTLRQAITLYQTANPNILVEYEIGMVDGGSITREDALKSLNTKIMAGEGPDVLILDNMPVDSYIEKGLLLDLSPVIDSLSGEEALFSNIVDAFRTEDKIYSIPCEIQLPVIFGKKKYIAMTGDLKGIADAAEELRKDYPGQNLLGICTEKGIMRMFSMGSVPLWKKDNDLDEEALREYLVQIKRIYDAQMDGLPAEDMKNYNDLNAYYLEDDGVTYDDSTYLRMGVGEMDFIAGNKQLVCGTLAYNFGYGELLSVQRIKGFEDCEAALMNADVFYAQTLAGINAASERKEEAENFVRLLLGKENQSSLFMGFAVNQAAFNKIREEYTEGDQISSVSMMDEEGNHIDLDIYWPDEKQIAALQKWMETVNTAYMEDDFLEETVYKEGISYLQGIQDLEDTIDAIQKKASLYMAE